MNLDKFNIRVYGLVINSNNEVLVSDEYRMGMYMTKFPGGGLQLGEGIIACLKREFQEELKLDIFNIRHYYTTDFFQKAYFFENQQLISIYYLVDIVLPNPFLVTTKKKFDFKELDECSQSFRWLKISELNDKEMTLPIDKVVINMLKKE